MNSGTQTPASAHPLIKTPTGIDGFDAITNGGLPQNRTTVIMGGAGTGKTVFALQTLVNGARDRNEAGIFIAFEEDTRQLIANMHGFGWDLETLLAQNKLVFFDGRFSADVVQSGKFDLAGLLVAIAAKAAEINAVHIVFDSLDVLLSLLNDHHLERRECYRLRDWLAQSGMTGIITLRIHDGVQYLEASNNFRFLEFMADCVVMLTQSLAGRVSLRELRVVKYRGSRFDENMVSIIIAPGGIAVSAIVEARQAFREVSGERVSTGVAALDEMMKGGYFRGSSVLISGAPGSAKSSLAAAFALAACMRGEKTLYFSSDQEASTLVRDLASINLHLAPHLASGVLTMYTAKKSARSMEEQLLRIRQLVNEEGIRCLVVDFLSPLFGSNVLSVRDVAERLFNVAWINNITVVFTGLSFASEPMWQEPVAQVATIVDTWIHLSYLSQGGERNRALNIMKSRGTGHSNQVRELILSDDGINLADVYAAKGEVLTGTARWEKEQELNSEHRLACNTVSHREKELALAVEESALQKQQLQAKLDLQNLELLHLIEERKSLEEQWKHEQSRRINIRSGREGG